MERLLVQSLQFLTVLLFGVHLYLKCVHFQKLCSFLDVVHTFLRLTGLVELFDDFGQTREVTLVETQLAQLREEEEGRITGGNKKEGREEDGERGDRRGKGEREEKKRNVKEHEKKKWGKKGEEEEEEEESEEREERMKRRRSGEEIKDYIWSLQW